MATQRESILTNLTPRIRKVLLEIGCPDKSLKRRVDAVRSVFKNGGKWKDALEKEGAITSQAIRNVAILKIWFNFTDKEIASIFAFGARDHKGVHLIVEAREMELQFRAKCYSEAVPMFEQIRSMLLDGGDINAVNIPFVPGTPKGTGKPLMSAPLPLSYLDAIDRIRETEEFQHGDPDKTAQIVECYVELGAYLVAQGLLKEALHRDPEHPGLWFQRARLLLAMSRQQLTEAASYNLMGDESEPLSPAAEHWKSMAMEAERKAGGLRDDVFDTCIHAYRLLPDRTGYEDAARKWSRGFRELRELRIDILLQIVQEAGRLCSPLRGTRDRLCDRVEARLDRLSKREPDIGSMPDRERTRLLRAEPLFSESTDRLVETAYRELFEGRSLHGRSGLSLRLTALDFLRVHLPAEEYRGEVRKFVEDLRGAFCGEARRFLGPYAWHDPSPRMVMHEHLDSVMSRPEQRELIRYVHRKYADWIIKTGDESAKSAFDDEIRAHFDKGDHAAAYRVACGAEDEGVYRRDDGHGALMLKRAASWFAEARAAGDKDAALLARAERHLADATMCRIAEDHYLQVYDDHEYATHSFVDR